MSRVLVIPATLPTSVVEPKQSSSLRIYKVGADVPNLRRHTAYYVLHPEQNRVYHISASTVDNIDGSLTMDLGNSFVVQPELAETLRSLAAKPPLYRYAELRDLRLKQIAPGLLVKLAEIETTVFAGK